MKKTMSKEVLLCDLCGKEQSYMEKCMNCATEMCYDCQKQSGRKYAHSVYCSGSGDGFYCNACDVSLTASGTNDRHKAYRAIKSLKNELHAWNEDFEKRHEAAKKHLKSLPA